MAFGLYAQLPKITIVNNTGCDIGEIYVVHDSLIEDEWDWICDPWDLIEAIDDNDAWGDNYLTRGVLRDGRSMEITLKRNINTRYNEYHIILVDDEDDYYLKDSVELRPNMRIVFNDDDWLDWDDYY